MRACVQAAVGTSFWTGVPLRDVLAACGVKGPRDKAYFVKFRWGAGQGAERSHSMPDLSAASLLRLLIRLVLLWAQLTLV